MVVLLRMARPVARAVQPAPAWRGTFLRPPQVQAVAPGGPGGDRGPACPAAAGSGADRPVGLVVMGWSPRKLLR